MHARNIQVEATLNHPCAAQAALECATAADWKKKPTSISLFPSGRCWATVAYLNDVLRAKVNASARRIGALRSDEEATFSVDDSARLIVDKWLRHCDGAATLVDDARAAVTSKLGATPRTDDLFGVHETFLPETTGDDRGGAASASVSASHGKGDELVPIPGARPKRVAEIYCARNSSVRCRLRVDVLKGLLDRFRAAQAETTRAIRGLAGAADDDDECAATATATATSDDDVDVDVDAALRRAGGRIPKKKRCAASETEEARPPDFLSHVFAMLLRYDDLAGDAGQHGAVPEAVFDVLAEWGCEAECCATPFNATLSRFCSPFLDTDAAFGSVGSFFAWEPSEGNYEINPPFTLTTDVIERHLKKLLDAAQDRGRPLAFTMIHAASHGKVVKDGPCARYIVSDFTLPPGQHYYREGKFFSKANPRAYVPPFPSVVLFIQNEVGRRTWPVTRDLEADIRAAFAWPLAAPPRPGASGGADGSAPASTGGDGARNSAPASTGAAPASTGGGGWGSAPASTGGGGWGSAPPSTGGGGWGSPRADPDHLSVEL